MKKKKKATSRPKTEKKIKVKKTRTVAKAAEKVSSDVARISLIAGDNFYEIAQVRAEGREENLVKAIGAYNRALSFYAFKDYPYNYGETQENLGNAYRSLSEVRDKEENLGLAVKAYKRALDVYTSDAFPVQYAVTQNNLGNAYRNLAGVRDKEKKLELAINAYKEALRVYTPGAFPINYAGTTFNVGHLCLAMAGMYSKKGDKEQEMESFKQAETAYAESLKLFKKERITEWVEEAEKHLASVRRFIEQIKE
ncbi:MAG: hypothetical protein ACE5IC_07005 [Candidatus Brocadiales bacterium]